MKPIHFLMILFFFSLGKICSAQVYTYLNFKYCNSFDYVSLEEEKCLPMKSEERDLLLGKVASFLLKEATRSDSKKVKEVVFSLSQYYIQIAKISVVNDEGRKENYFEVNAYRVGDDLIYQKIQKSWVNVDGGGNAYFNVGVDAEMEELILEINPDF